MSDERLLKVAFELGMLEADVYREYGTKQDKADINPTVDRIRTLLTQIEVDPKLADLYTDFTRMNGMAEGQETETVPEALLRLKGEEAHMLHNLAANLSLWIFLEGDAGGLEGEAQVARSYVREMVRGKYNRFAPTYERKLRALGVDRTLPEMWEQDDNHLETFQLIMDNLKQLYS